MKKDYTKKKLFVVNEFTYNDGITRYEIEDGDSSTSGMYDDIDLLIEILRLIGKIELKSVTISR